MSDTSQVLGVVGAAVGYYFGGAQGAQIGFTIGSAVGGYIDPVTIRAPGLNDAPAQTSRDGVPTPIIWGLQYCHGNIIQKNPEQIVVTTERQGKGGGPKVETPHRFRTFAIRVCEGPISEVTRIWENGKLVYDVRENPAIPAEETAAYAEGITIYLGDEAQLPDPELEAHWGVDETPAYRGRCYIVWNNKDLTDLAGAIPQFAFEVQATAELRSTSHPYALEWWDGMDNAAGPDAGKSVPMPFEGMDNQVIPQDGLLGSGLVEYEIPPEGMDNQVTPQAGLLGGGLVEYVIPPEGMDNAVTPEDGLLGSGLIEYSIPAEGMDNAVTPNDGVLETP